MRGRRRCGHALPSEIARLPDDAFVTAAVRCAPPDNKPTPAERDRCAPYLERELDAPPTDTAEVLVTRSCERIARGLGAVE